MTTQAEHLDHARKVADAILYEGYLLYPYRQSSQKNRSRFQFGVLMPPAYHQIDPTERSTSQTQCLAECSDDAVVMIRVRFLQLQRRQGGTDDDWDEAVEREEHVSVSVADLAAGAFQVPFSFGPEELVAGKFTRSLTAIYGTVAVTGERVAGPYRALRLTVRIENHSTPKIAIGSRDDALRYALIAAHTVIAVPGGAFISMTDPPEWAAPAVAECVNEGTWPVLAGPPECRDLVLSSPVILYDHAEVAPESGGDLFDATEIDEILTLRTLALTDEEKREARATDPRAREVIDRLEGMPPEMFDRLHGAIRYLGSPQPPRSSPPPAEQPPVPVPWWDPGADSSVSPQTDQVIVNGVPVGRGSKVVMRPGVRRADAQDLFLTDRTATVEAVLYDADGNIHLAVIPDDNPAADLQRNHGRFLYFATDEIEPIG